MTELRYQVIVSPEAQRQLDDISDWWAENRRQAPGAVEADMDAAIDLLGRQPEIAGRDRRRSDRRRLHLRRIRYHVYYTVDHARRTVEISAVRHESRPPLS